MNYAAVTTTITAAGATLRSKRHTPADAAQGELRGLLLLQLAFYAKSGVLPFPCRLLQIRLDSVVRKEQNALEHMKMVSLITRWWWPLQQEDA